MLKDRPTEVGSVVVSAIAWLICYFANVTDQTVYLALVAVIAFVPSAITWVVVKFRSQNP